MNNLSETLKYGMLLLLIAGVIAATPSVAKANGSGLTRTPGGVLVLNIGGGTGDSVQSTNTGGDLNLGNSFTLEAWVYLPTGTYSGTDAIISKQGAYSLDITYTTAPSANITGSYFSGSSAQDLTTSSPVLLTTGGWHHIAFVKDGTATSLYFDLGRVANATSQPSTLDTNSNVLKIGNNNSSQFFEGYIDEVQLSNSARYSGTSISQPPDEFTSDVNTKALYHFNELSSAFQYHDVAGTDDSLFAEGGAATLVDLVNFKAKAKKNRIVLKWKTDSETYNAGFDILRSESRNGEYVAVNNDIIPSDVNDAVGGAKYRYVDRSAETGKRYFYKLVDIEIDGDENVNEPNPSAKIKDKSKRQKKHRK